MSAEKQPWETPPTSARDWQRSEALRAHAAWRNLDFENSPERTDITVLNVIDALKTSRLLDALIVAAGETRADEIALELYADLNQPEDLTSIIRTQARAAGWAEAEGEQ